MAKVTFLLVEWVLNYRKSHVLLVGCPLNNDTSDFLTCRMGLKVWQKIGPMTSRYCLWTPMLWCSRPICPRYWVILSTSSKLLRASSITWNKNKKKIELKINKNKFELKKQNKNKFELKNNNPYLTRQSKLLWSVLET